MRTPLVVLLALLTAVPAAAQRTAHPWKIALTATTSIFRGVSADTSSPDIATARPTGSLGLGIGLSRQMGPWEAELGLSVLAAHLEVVSSDVTVQGRFANIERLRIAPSLGRRLTSLGSGTLHLRAGPTVDIWSIDNSDHRAAFGGEAVLALRFPMGRFELENAVSFGWSESLFHAADLPEGYEVRSLRTLSFGASLLYGL